MAIAKIDTTSRVVSPVSRRKKTLSSNNSFCESYLTTRPFLGRFSDFSDIYIDRAASQWTPKRNQLNFMMEMTLQPVCSVCCLFENSFRRVDLFIC